VTAALRSQFELFDGGSVSQHSAEDNTTVMSHSGDELDQGAMFELVAASAPSGVGGLVEASSLIALDDATDGWFYDTSDDTLWMKLASGNTEATIQW